MHRNKDKFPEINLKLPKITRVEYLKLKKLFRFRVIFTYFMYEYSFCTSSLYDWLIEKENIGISKQVSENCIC